ncbi:MAG: low molecular weight phosphotyrosine protein phosphatase [Halioglobus sp.]|nr:low molecular weight phosphotyrosine protein phosphatase [Halioglobus sp.]
MAEGLLTHYLREMDLDADFEVASAGSSASQAGRRPDPRAQKVAGQAGIDLSRIRARRFSDRDFDRSDMIVAMDENNLRELQRSCPAVFRSKLSLLLDYHPDGDLTEVPDPYYGSAEGFQDVFEIIDAAVYGLVPHISARFA